jgi:RNA polymerase sigma-70 factor, ECF subfamily
MIRVSAAFRNISSAKRSGRAEHPCLVQAEGEIVERSVPGEAIASPASFDEFFLDEHERLYRALYFVTGNRHDAEELMQDAFLKIWERWPSVGELGDVTAYLYRVALNGFRMRARRTRTAARRAVRADPASDPFDAADLRADLRRMLLGLSVRQRSALVLTEILGYSSQQAGQIMGIQPTTVRVLASQGRAALRATT